MKYRKHRAELAPLYINRECVERVHTFKFLGTHISEDLSWSANTTAVVKKAQMRLHFLRVLRKNNLEGQLLVAFYCSTIESILAYCISVWYAGCSVADRRALQIIINTAQKITGSSPSCYLSLEPKTSSRTLHILDTTCLTCCPLAGATGPSVHGPIDSRTSSFPGP
ncbi:hypothetical protein N1851_019833 [Merluccius polli]|uniref:Alkylated DNA repair protein AlkB homologue 8 N-terminal domain-containing protein n=1 Tax=Merluccius polli TaxID=89951 RepID=A0AA47MLR8_MERPO|nr:hypothetical protein N1851_019833 [Merluccius polli]